MEAQLQELIDRIKTEGVAEAEGEAKKIIQEAREQASAITDKAHKEAERIVGDAKAAAARFETTGREAVTQAARNVILGLRSSITELLGKVVSREVKAALSEDVMQKIICNLVEEWLKRGDESVEVLLSPKDLKGMEESCFAMLAEEMKKGVELKPLPEIEAGFRVGRKNGSVYYDFTDAGIVEYLTQYLNPKLAECMKEE